jgi:transcriptional repressor of dcmA and dcmR
METYYKPEDLLKFEEIGKEVPEMTVRRWTNSGSLHCYRVGSRRARRFRPQDLMAFLEGNDSSAGTAMVRLGINEFEVPDGSHLTHLSVGPHEALAASASYIVEGLANGETVCVVTPASGTEKIIKAMRQRSTDAQKFEKFGKLFFSRGMDSPDGQVRYISEMTSRSGGRFRIFGDMTWTQAKSWRETDLRRLEEACSLSPLPRDMLFLCQYPLGSFTGKEVMMALETHSHSIYRGELRPTPYCQ